MLAFELPTAISSASNALATVLYSDDEKVKRRCQGLKQSDFTTLKRNLAQISYEKELLRSSRTEVASYLDKIALILNDDILEGHYVSSFASNSSQVHVFSPDLARFQTFASFVAVLAEKPPRFEVIEAVRSDATNKLSELSYLLKDFSNVLDDADPEDLEAPYVHESTSQRKFPNPQIATGAFPNVRSLAENLHNVLHKCWPCQELHHDHSGALGLCERANMQLDPEWIIRGPEDGGFFIILSGTDINQECKICLSRTTASEADGGLLCLIPHDECKECCLSLVADTSGQLWESGTPILDVQLHVQEDPRQPAQYKLLSLGQLLHSLEPSYAAKRVIGMILARSLLVLLNGPWVGNSLSMDDVFVFCKFEQGEPRPFFEKVFVSTRFGRHVNAAPSRRQRNAHPFPAIQALGILIAEIELADDLEHIYRDVPVKDKMQKPGQIATMLFKEAGKRLPGGAGVLRCIEFCIKRDSLKNFVYRSTPVALQEDIEFVRNYYLEIVRPLEEDLVVGANWSWEQIHWRESRELDDCGIAKIIPRSASEDKLRGQGRKVLNILPSLEEEQEHTHVQSLRPHRRHRLLQQPQADGDVVFDAGRCVLASDNVSLSTDDWFAELRDVHKNLNRDRMDSLNEEEMEELVKVAVIDTGIDLDHPDFQAVLKSGQLDLGIDLVDRGERISDLDGHGTHVCHTLLQTAPYVKLYPMRVFRTSKREDCTPNLIKQAIYHAIEIWDVDIISMSFAFEEEEADIKEALRNAKSKASDKNALMFAAASNNRALRINPVGYPARAINRVICVNSSTVHDRPSDFSPEGQPGQPNLSAVGENVEAAWPVSGDAGDETTRKRMSGTSCATPIVAGIAAMVLDFAKKDGPELRSLRDWDVKKGELWETLGMISVLKRCMTAGKDDRSYNFLKPWRLLKEPDFSIIAVKIIEALRLKYGWG